MPASIKVFTSNSMRTVMSGCVPLFERDSGVTVTVSLDPALITLKRIAQGESADVAILGDAAMKQLVAEGKIVAASCRALVHSDAAIAVRAGAAKPDIGSVEAFRRTLLAARSIAYASEGASGIHFARVIAGMGIEKEIAAKAVTRPGGLLAELLVSGEAELAIQHVPELMAVKGITVVGPFPPGLEFANTLAAGIFADAREPAAARAFMEFMTTPASVARLVAEGLRPAF